MSKYPYAAMFGVGGIGTGTFFLLEGNHTLGREESRLGRRIDRRDYCKLHIISHYCKSLLGDGMTVFPIGRVGNDDAGAGLTAEMQEAGLDLRFMGTSLEKPTLFSFCLVYPDGSGGNVTTSDSACSEVSADMVSAAESSISPYKGRAVVLAVPEVPLDARIRLVELGTKYSLMRAASFTSGEITDQRILDLLPCIDLIALNIHEAAAFTGSCAESEDDREIVSGSVKRLSYFNSKMIISITSGSKGSWIWDGCSISHLPAYKVQAEGTSGAGDAHFSGMIAGLAAGLTAADSHKLASLVAAMSVMSPHTINKHINPSALLEFALSLDADLSPELRKLMEVAK